MKSIRSAKDLAINGAVPAFGEPVHVGRPNLGNREAFHQYVDDIFDRDWLTNNGPLVQELEQKVAAFHGVKHCIAMANGTIALEIAIRALGLQGEVIVPSYTFVATVHALHWQAITPVFADIDPHTHNLDPEAVRRAITPRTSGIIGVHLWGRAAPVDELSDIAAKHDIELMFDAAHAFGCSYKGKMIGSFGHCEVLSFHATKFFNTFEGGAILTNDDDLAQKTRLMRNFGFAGMDNVIYPGTNGKMSEIAAAMGLVNLESTDDIMRSNFENFTRYCRNLEGLPGVNLMYFDESQRNNFQYVVLELGEEFPVSRDELIDALHAENVRARRYFWPGAHRMKPYDELYPEADALLPHTRVVAERVVVLPTGPTLSSDAVDVVSTIIRILAGEAR